MASDDALLVADRAGRVVEWSREAHELFGRAASETVGRPVAALLSSAWTRSDGVAGARPGGVAENAGLLVRPVTRPDGVPAWGLFRPPPDTRGGPDEIGHALLDALFTQSTIGMQVLDPDLRVLRVNIAASGMSALTGPQLVGRRLQEVVQLTDPVAADAMVRGVLASGEPVLERIVGARPPSAPEREHLYSVSVFRLQDPDGQVLGAATAVVDVSDRERARARTDPPAASSPTDATRADGRGKRPFPPAGRRGRRLVRHHSPLRRARGSHRRPRRRRRNPHHHGHGPSAYRAPHPLRARPRARRTARSSQRHRRTPRRRNAPPSRPPTRCRARS